MNQTFESRMCDFVFLAELDEFGASNAIAIAREMDAREAALLVKLREHEDAVVQRDAELFRLRQELSEAKAALAARDAEIARIRGQIGERDVKIAKLTARLNGEDLRSVSGVAAHEPKEE